ncbi:MAG: DNA polymerase III subunit beta [Candidatus Faecousia sp.]|nr:DNA polymerase III subunit beta [Candidatus Faecousia sp.]
MICQERNLTMRFTCEKSMLVSGLNIAGRTVAQKSSLSVIEGILCRAGMGLSLTGYNMETAITYDIDAEVTDPGDCILPAKLFGDIIRRLPEGPVTVVVDEAYKVSIRAGYASFTISAESAEDYPELPDVNDGRPIHIPQSRLKELISGTIFAVSENQGRPIHTGVKFEVTNDSITTVAVDGFRLARRTFHPEESTQRELNFVVPAAGLKEVEKIVTDSDEDASFTLGSKHILFQMGNATLVCRLLEGEFLDWRKVVPTNCPIKLVAHVSDLMSSVERVGLIVSEKYKSPVRCTFSNQELMMRTNTTIGAAEDRCSLAGDGKDLEIGFNVRYLADALRVIPSEEVTLELTNGLSPIVLTPVEDKYDFAYMVLPVRIKNG